MDVVTRLAAPEHIHWPDRVAEDVRCVTCSARMTATDTPLEPKPRQLCVACGYHDGYHHEDCDLPTWTEAELRAADGDR